MSRLLTNAFELPPDGWYQISATGEFPHNPTGLMQIIDEESCRCMAGKFQEEAASPNFAGLLIDFDHFSLEKDKPSEAAGWIMGLESRPGGLWAQIRWSDRGEQAVKGGRYRFISPVWREDECMDLGNKRLRPMRLLNAAVTNDPNIKGMFPLSNRARPGEAPERSRALPISNRTAVHFARGNLLARGVYHDPRTGDLLPLVNRAPMSEEQRKAMFAKMNGGGGGGGHPAGGGSAADTPSGVTTDHTDLNDPVRQSADRVNEFNRQIRDLEGQRTAAPAAPDYAEVDTRELQRQMLAAGRSTNETFAAVREAEAANQQKRDALREVRSRARRAYPGDPEKQRKYFDKLQADEIKVHQKGVDTWTKQNKSLQDKIDKLVAARNTEEIRQKEELYRSAQRQMRGDSEAETRAARDQQSAAQRQVEADKKAAREQAATAEKARKDAERAAAKAGQKTDPASAYRSELGRRRLYWQAAARGEWETAKQLYPAANHEQNRKDMESLVPKHGSKANQAAYQKAIAQMQSEAP
jgi:hypothetical protein